MTKLQPVVQATQQLAANLAKSARLKVAHILPDKNQPRKTFDPDKYEETKASIKAIGLQVPITVNPGPIIDGIQYYYLKYGENRWRIHVDLNWEEIDCVIDPKPYTGELDVLRILTQAAENINRIEHTHGEIATVYALYFEDQRKKAPWKIITVIQQDFATIFGKSTMWVQNYATMSNLRPELLARVDPKGPSQIPFMAAVALGRNPKERQTGILHGAEALAGSRRDMLYSYILHGTNQAKKANGEKVRSYVTGNRQSLMRIPARVKQAIDQFGAEMQSLDRDKHIRETLSTMSQPELIKMLEELDEALSATEGLKNAVEGKLEILRDSRFFPQAVKTNEEIAPEPPAEVRSPWPSFTHTRDAEVAQKNGQGYSVRQIKGDRY